MMTKTQFVEALRESLPEVFTTKASADKAFDVFCKLLADGIVADEGVRLPNVGAFSLGKRAARTGRNPKTGEEIRIPARKVIKFAPAKNLKEAVNQQ